MLLEIHCHTKRHSKCSQADPVDLVKKIIAKGLQGLILTEHRYLWSGEELARLREEAGAEKWFLLAAGQEVETDFGHVLVFGAARSIEEKIRLSDLRKEFPEAALVWAHPFRKGSLPEDAKLLSTHLDGIEIFSLNHTARENFEALKAWHRLKFTALSGSDTHNTGTAGTLPSQFDHDPRNITEIAFEIRKGRVRPFFKEIPKSGSELTVTEITLGTKGGDEIRQRMIVKTVTDENKWGKIRATAELMSDVREKGMNGPSFRVPGVIDISLKDMTLIEEGQRGKSLFETLSSVSPEVGRKYFGLSAGWLAKFHSLKLRSGDGRGTAARERKKLASYRKNLSDTRNPSIEICDKLLELVAGEEEKIFAAQTDRFTLSHGDYHPKNIIIGSDMANDPGAVFVSVIDFANALSFVPEFDIGYFLAQFSSQFSGRPDILKYCGEKAFLDAYLNGAEPKPEFLRLVNLFRARANLSIINYFIRVGQGENSRVRELALNSLELLK